MLCKRILISLGAAALVMPLIHCGSKHDSDGNLFSSPPTSRFRTGKPRVQGFHRLRRSFRSGLILSARIPTTRRRRSRPLIGQSRRNPQVFWFQPQIQTS